MSIEEAIKLLAQRAGEMYCKVCTVDAIDEKARTVDVSPIDESAPILGVNLQANQSTEAGLVLFPKQGSHVIVAFLNANAAVVILTETVEKALLKIGEKSPVELTIVDGSAALKVGDTTAEITKEKKITLNDGKNGGLTITPTLAAELKKMSARIDGVIDAIKNGKATPQDGGTGLQTTIVASLAKLTNVEDFSKIENKDVTH